MRRLRLNGYGGLRYRWLSWQSSLVLRVMVRLVRWHARITEEICAMARG